MQANVYLQHHVSQQQEMTSSEPSSCRIAQTDKDRKTDRQGEGDIYREREKESDRWTKQDSRTAVRALYS